MIKQRAQLEPCVGLDISDTQIRFLELVPRKGLLVPNVYGVMPLEFGTVTNGEVTGETELVGMLKQLFEKTSASTVCLRMQSQTAWDDEWRELLRVAGFSEQVLLTREVALPCIMPFMGREKMVYGEFEGSMVCIKDSGQKQIFSMSYPFDESVIDEHIERLDNLLREYEQTHIPLVGHLPALSHVIQKSLVENKLPIQFQNLWFGCFDFSRFVPALSFDASFTYTWAIAYAHCGARFSQAKSRVTDTRQDISNAYAALEPLSRPQSEHATAGESYNQAAGSLSSEPHERVLQQTEDEPFEDMAFMTRAERLAMKETDSSKSEDTVNNNSHAKKRSIWLRDVDEMIYGMFGVDTASLSQN